MKIALDAGHGMNTAGKRTPDGIHEWELNSKVCNYIAEYLQGYASVMRTDDMTGNKDVSLSTRRTNAVNNCDVLVSIHHNALNSNKFSGVTGVETFTHLIWATSQSKKLAEVLANKISQNTGLKNRGAKKASLSVIATSKIPAVLCEGGFMDGEHDSYYIRTEEGQRAYAKAVAEGLIEFFGLTGGQAIVEITQTNNAVKNTSGIVASIQSTLNSRYGLSISVDNIYGKETKKALVKALQTELNEQYNKGLVIDGIFGNKTKNACVSVKKGAKGNITYILQALLTCNGYSTNGVDGIFGSGTENAVRQYQAIRGLAVDGIAGKNTFAKLCA